MCIWFMYSERLSWDRDVFLLYFYSGFVFYAQFRDIAKKHVFLLQNKMFFFVCVFVCMCVCVRECAFQLILGY